MTGLDDLARMAEFAKAAPSPVDTRTRRPWKATWKCLLRLASSPRGLSYSDVEKMFGEGGNAEKIKDAVRNLRKKGLLERVGGTRSFAITPRGREELELIERAEGAKAEPGGIAPLHAPSLRVRADAQVNMVLIEADRKAGKRMELTPEEALRLADTLRAQARKILQEQDAQGAWDVVSE
jgi:DNA-binding PadR family transcriptional regulator